MHNNLKSYFTEDDRTGEIVLTILALALLSFTASRTVDLIQSILPADQWLTAYLTLAALDGGLIGWVIYYLRGAKEGTQIGVAKIMIIVCLVGVITAFIGDLLYNATTKGMAKLSTEGTTAIIIFLGAVIAANIASITAIHTTDPQAQAQRHARIEQFKTRQAEVARLAAIEAENAALDSEIASEEIKIMRENKTEIAKRAAKNRAAAWTRRTREKHGILSEIALPTNGDTPQAAFAADGHEPPKAKTPRV